MALWFRAYLFCVAFSVAGLLLQRATGAEATGIARAMGVVTLATGLGATCAALGLRFVPAAGVWALGFAVEVLGLATGFPFGRYEYTGAWWPSVTLGRIGEFPVLLPFAWLLMAAGATGLACLVARQSVARALLAGGFAMLADIPLEFAATGRLGYWRWLDAPPGWVAPLQNFAAWFVVASLGSALLLAARPPCPAPRTAASVLGIHVAFTVFVALAG